MSYDPYKAATGLANLVQGLISGVMAQNYVNHLKEVTTEQNPSSYAMDDVIGTVMGIWASGKLAKGVKAVSDPVGTVKAIKNAPENMARATAEAITDAKPRTSRLSEKKP